MQSRDELVVKEVDFMGDTLMAAKDHDGKIWAGISYFCRGLGMSKSQKDTQVEKVQSDDLLKNGAGKFPAGKLLEYQLKAKDVLAEAFLPTYKSAEKAYETKATSIGEIASFNKEMDKRMEKQGSAPYKICEAFKMVSEQLGIILPADFVKVPAYEQMGLLWAKKEQTQ